MKPFLSALSIAVVIVLLVASKRENGSGSAERLSVREIAPLATANRSLSKPDGAIPRGSGESASVRKPTESVQAVLPNLAEHVADWRAFQPSTIVVQLEETLRVPFEVSSVQVDSSRTVLTARLEGDTAMDGPLAGSYLVATAVASDRWDALAVLPGMEYRITVRGGHATVEEQTDHGMICATDLPPPASDNIVQTPQSGKTPQATASADLTVDVLFLYNAEALADRKGDTLAIEADCSNYIAASNAVLANSKIGGFVWRYLGAEAAPAYATTEHTLDDLRAMRGAGAIADFVDARQRSRGADQVVMLAGGRKADAVGRAWVGGAVAHSVVSYPYATYGEGFRSSSVTSYTTVCHEMAHNFGCNHQRDDASTEAKDGDGKYHYAHVAKGKYGLNGTIMAVYLTTANMTRVPYFSTAEVSYEGATLGVAQDQPRAALNARILADNASRVAGLHTPPAPPAIVEHPQSLTVTAGDTATFAVKASGEGLSYTWTRNGAALTGSSNSENLSLVSVGLEAAGDYTVTVSNAHGSATSFAATLVVNPRAVTPPPSTAPEGAVVGNDAPPSSPNPATPPPSNRGEASASGAGSLSAGLALALVALVSARLARGGINGVRGGLRRGRNAPSA